MLQWKGLCIRKQLEGEVYSYLSNHKVNDLFERPFLNNEKISHSIKRITGSKKEAKINIERNGPALKLKVVTRSVTKCGMKCCKNLWKLCEQDRDDVICPQWLEKSSKSFL